MTPQATHSLHPSRAPRTTGAVLGAAATFVVLLGVVALADSPRRLTVAAPTAPSGEFATGLAPAVADLSPAFAQAPATGSYVDPGLQVVFDVYA
jgi:hypothetical protein